MKKNIIRIDNFLNTNKSVDSTDNTNNIRTTPCRPPSLPEESGFKLPELFNIQPSIKPGS